MYKLCYYRFGQVYTEQGTAGHQHSTIASCSAFIDWSAHPRLRLCFGPTPGQPQGYDRVRNVEIGNKNFELEHLEEAYTTQHWLVRIYKVLPPMNRG